MDMNYYYKLLAQNIKIERVKNKISQMQLADLANISLDTLGNIEREKGNPTLSTIIAIAMALNVELNVLIPLNR